MNTVQLAELQTQIPDNRSNLCLGLRDISHQIQIVKDAHASLAAKVAEREKNIAPLVSTLESHVQEINSVELARSYVTEMLLLEEQWCVFVRSGLLVRCLTWLSATVTSNMTKDTKFAMQALLKLFDLSRRVEGVSSCGNLRSLILRRVSSLQKEFTLQMGRYCSLEILLDCFAAAKLHLCSRFGKALNDLNWPSVILPTLLTEAQRLQLKNSFQDLILVSQR